MSDKQSHLNYEFYFLFQVELDDTLQHWREPLSLDTEFAKDNLHSIKVDKDKRLFRYAPPPAATGELPPLAEWENHLQQGWAQIRACYNEAFQPTVKPGKSQGLQAVSIEQAFMGVALLIMDETVAAHKITLNTSEGEITFQPAKRKTLSEKILLKITGKLAELTDSLKTPVTLEEFEPKHSPAIALEHWQLQRTATQPPLLTPMQVGERFPNPIFAVYALAHGVLPDEADWPAQLQLFLCSGQTAVLARVLPRLMMQKWQFQRLNIAAKQLRQRLDAQNAFYQQQDDAHLECASNRLLENNLRDMHRLNADAKQVLARLDAGVKTLEINRYNLQRHLRRSGQVWQTLNDTPPDDKYDWFVTWEHDTDTPLLDGFELAIRNLQNHATYLQDALAYLKGIRNRWQLHLDGRRLVYESNIQITLLVLTFLATFTGVIAFITQKPEYVTLVLQGFINVPPLLIEMAGYLLLLVINIIVLIFFVLPFFYLYLRLFWKRLRCFIRHLGEL